MLEGHIEGHAEEHVEGHAEEHADAATTMHVRRALAGDSDGIAWIVQRFGPALLAQARYRLARLPPGLCEPEDLVQEAWLVALPRLPALPPRDGRHTPVVMRFLATTLLNRSNTLAQKHLFGKPTTAGDDALATLPADLTGVVSQVARGEAFDRLAKGIEQLSAADREIIVLRGIEQNSNETIALLLGIEPNTAAVRYKRALERLRRQGAGTVFDALD